LFFSKYTPTDFQRQAKITSRDKFGFGTVRNIDNLKFRDISWDEIEAVSGKVLVAGTPEETAGKPAIKEIVNESGKVMFRLVEKR